MTQADRFPLGTRVRKASGPEWRGVVVGYYSSTYTPEGLVIECTVPEVQGALHIYNPEQLEVTG